MMALEEVASFVNAGSCEITASETEVKDWMNNWKQYFKPFVVDDLLIKQHGKKFLREWKERS